MSSERSAIRDDFLGANPDCPTCADVRRKLVGAGVLNRAVGMVMEAQQLDGETAWARFRDHSRDTNRKVRLLAVDVVERRVSAKTIGRR